MFSFYCKAELFEDKTKMMIIDYEYAGHVEFIYLFLLFQK